MLSKVCAIKQLVRFIRLEAVPADYYLSKLGPEEPNFGVKLWR